MVPGSMDLLVRGGTVVTCDEHDRVFEGDVLVRDGVIVALGPDAAASAKKPHRVLDAVGCAVIPGFVQAHVHLVQVLFRGMADDLPLLAWLKERIWPLEAAHDEASLRASAELGLLELLRHGTTTILDMGTTHGHEVVLDAIDRFGLRARSGKAMMDLGEGVPARLRERTEDSLREVEAHARAFAAHPRVRVAVSPRFILSCSERLIREGALLAREHRMLVHTHAAEHAAERTAVRELLGDDDITLLARWGATGPNTVLAHGVQLDPREMNALADAGTRVAHCPSANLKLGSGIAQVHAMRRAGVVVGLGADGAPCNNNLDALTELRHAALLSKARAGTDTLPAREALRLATIDGARVLGMEREIGSLETGKRGDLVCIDLGGVHAEPGGDAVSRVVYACRASDVRHVVLDGAVRVRSGEVLDLDADEILATARVEARKTRARAGI
ncbi:MAG: amidohydrolase family protein [Sandaracinaceae bacterium]|nr:amidohydrolase family protein [Sandaracinaceae bacterium]